MLPTLDLRTLHAFLFVASIFCLFVTTYWGFPVNAVSVSFFFWLTKQHNFGIG